MPFLVRYPGVVAPASKAAGLFSTVDIYPTMCGIAGLTVPGHCVGHDLSSAMRGQSTKYPESSFLMHIAKDGASGGQNNPAPLFRGIRTDQHTYAFGVDGRWLLYDNREDPFQMHNLVDDEKTSKLRSDLEGLMFDWLKAAHDPFPLESVRKNRSAMNRA